MNNTIVTKTYMVEIPIPASSTNQTINFPTLQNLDGKLIQGISTYSVLSVLKSPTNTALANDSLLKSSYITLVQGDVNQIWNTPLVEFVTISSPTLNIQNNKFAVEFDNLRIIWAKSYIFIADVTTIAATAQSFIINIKYIDDPALQGR